MSKHKRKQSVIKVRHSSSYGGIWKVSIEWPIKAGNVMIRSFVHSYERKSSAVALANKLEAELNDAIVEVED